MLLDRAIRLCLCAALLIVPLAFDPRLHHAFVLDKTVLLRLLVSGAAILWAAKALREGGRIEARTGLDRPIFAVLGAAVVATAFSASPRISLVGSAARQEGLVALATDLLLFYLSFRFLKERPQRVAGLVCLAAVVAACYGILQRMGGDPLSWSEPVWARVTSTFGQPNALGAYLGTALPLVLAVGTSPTPCPPPSPRAEREGATRASLLAWGRVRSAVSRFLFCPAFLIVGIALLLTGSRGGWMGAAAGLALFGALTWPRGTREARRMLALCAALTAGVIGAFCLHPGLSPARRIASTVRVEQTKEGRSILLDGTARERLVTYRASWKMFLDRPLTGVGPEMMREFLPRYLSPDDPETEADRAHNLLLHEAVTKGLVGLAAMIYLLVVLGVLAVRSSENSSWPAAYLSAALAYVVQGLVGFGWPATTALFWVSAAMACPGNRRGEVTSPLRGRWVAPLLVVLFALTNAGLAVAAYRADLAYARGLRRMEAGEAEAALSACRSAHRSYPLSAEYLAGLGLLLHRAAGRAGEGRWLHRIVDPLPEAEGAMAGAVGMDPEDGHLWAWLGMVRVARYRATGDAALALAAGRAYQEAVRRVPKSPAVYVNLANLLVETGRGADAGRVCEEGVSRNPRSVELLSALGRAHQLRGEGEEAARVFRRVLALEPASGAAHQALGRIAFERGDFEGAAEAYGAAAALEPGSAARQNDLGSALFKAGRYGEAGRALREALRIDPENAYAREVLAAILARDSVRTGAVLAEVPRLSREAVIDLRDPAHRRYLREGWSYTETWGTWGVGEASEVVFSLQGVADGSLTVRATALGGPGRAQTMGVYLNDRFLAHWTFTRPAWEWETFRVPIAASAFRRGANRLTFRYARSDPAAQEDRRPVAVAFERIALGPP